MPRFGAHMSISGGIALAFDRLAEVEGEALQIFTANQRQWHPKTPTPEEIKAFKARRQQAPDIPVASHDSYLINLASPKPEAADKSIDAFAGELRRCAALGIEYLVVHPGSHLGEGIEAGLKIFTANLDRAISEANTEEQVMILLETTAGQGTNLGASFEELAAIIAGSAYPEKLGVCYDTCHTFAAGYDIRTPKAYAETMTRFDRLLGLERLKFFHLNDASKGLGSRIDRHTHIGEGEITLEGFRHLINDPRFADHPMVLETPKSDDLHEDRENLALLRSLLE
ncbi:MAG: deoxyribonuclease IV [Desulfobulbaceae bacterium]|nr:deoxyribonuclease IV [Desulfobulbaceae bacterium]HIJ90132.1 deoxyribonuclease IV [Deltaproteobacteria bacterium]